MKKSAIVIPNWNGEAFIKQCLESLEDQAVEAHIIVIDNGSSDGSVETIQKNFPSVEIIGLEKNYGFAGGVNRGIEMALADGADYIALFNNDAVADKNWLKHLVEAAKKHKDCGIITGKLLKNDKTHIDSTGEFLTTRGMPFPRGRNEANDDEHNDAGFVFGASGGASLYRADMLKKIGLFDEDFFAYFEDVDISFRAQLSGYRVWYEPKAVAYHAIGGTSSKLGDFARFHSIKNVVYLYNKNMPGVLFWKYKPLLFYQLARMAVGSMRDGVFKTYLKAFCKALVSLPHTWSKRRTIQKNRVVPISYIDDLLIHSPPPKTRDL